MVTSISGLIWVEMRTVGDVMLIAILFKFKTGRWFDGWSVSKPGFLSRVDIWAVLKYEGK